MAKKIYLLVLYFLQFYINSFLGKKHNKHVKLNK